ncbi:MAG TPA: pitrilysin family protein [Syntrophorhabdaceae bacterium]|nr:pitrilysin family protein [Syntrophorhabdaceae bacterium]
MNTFSLQNGLQTIFERREGTGVVAAQIWVKVGSKYEDEKIAGITHFIEHLIFKGTEKLQGNAFAARIESLGGTVNAFTSYDNTVYHIIVPKSSFEEGLGLLIESVQHPAFPADEIEKERKVVLEEIKMGEDDPQRKLFNELFNVSYQGHPYARPIIGFENTVKGIDRSDILRYYKSHYVPGNMTVVIVGDFDEAKAKEAVQNTLGKQAGMPPTNELKLRDGEKDTDVRILERNVRENYIAISYPIPQLSHKDMPAIEVMCTILGAGESSRLSESLKRKKGVVTGISDYTFSPRENGLFVVYATFRQGDYGPVVSEIHNELKKLRRGAISNWEMEKAKNMLKASYIYSEETVQGKARQLGNYQTLIGDPRFPEKYLKQIDKVTKEDVRRVFDTYVAGRQGKIVFLKPGQKSNPFTLKLPNGLTCVVNRNKTAPTFSFRIGFAGGLKEEPQGKNGLFNILSKMLLRGTKKKSASAIAREIDFLAGEMSPYNGRNIFGLSGKFLSKDLKAVLSLTRELLMETDLKSEELKQIQDEVLSDIRQRDDDPVGFTFNRFNEIFYKGHPYAKDAMGTEKDVEGINLRDVSSLYKRFVTPSHVVIAISGDVNEGEVFRLVKEMFSGWKGVNEGIVAKRPAVNARNVSIEKQIMQTHMIFGFEGPGLIDEDRFAAEVLDGILSGMGGRIHKVLREENPYAYAVTFFNQQAYETSAMGIYIGTDVSYMKDVQRIAGAEIENIVRDGFNDKDIEDGKKYLIGNHYIRMQSNGAIATSMCFDTIYGMKPGFFKEYPARIGKVTKEDVNRVARKYLLSDKMVELIVGRKD